MLTPVGKTVAEYTSAIRNGNFTHIRMTFTDQNIVLDDSDISMDTGLVVNEMLNGDTDLIFGKAVSKELNVSILNSTKLSGLSWTSEFKLELGVEFSGVTNYVTIGYFTGEKPNNVTMTTIIHFTAKDRMTKFDIPVEDYLDSITYPATLETIYHGLCTFCGVGYTAGNELPGIMSRTYSEAPYDLEGYLCRDVLAWIAEAAGCYARINAAGNCQLVWFSDQTSYTVNADSEFAAESSDIMGMIWDDFDKLTWNEADKLTWNDVCGYEEAYAPDYLNVVMLDSEVEVVYPAKISSNAYCIVGNPYLTISSGSDITNYIAPIWNRLAAFGGHLPMNVECIGNWLVEAGDVLTINIGDKTIAAPVFVRTLTWKGFTLDEYETTGNMLRQQMSGDTREKLMRVNSIRLFVKDQYYKEVSGIDIDENGIEIVGNKYVRISSGGGLDVNSNNFILDSDNRLMKAGNWSFDDDGILHNNNVDLIPFEITKFESMLETAAGIYMYYNTGKGKIILRAACPNDKHASPTGYWCGELALEMNDNEDDGDLSGRYISLYPQNMGGVIGTASHPWYTMYTFMIKGTIQTGGYGALLLVPNPDYSRRNVNIQLIESQVGAVNRILLTGGSNVDLINIHKVNVIAGHESSNRTALGIFPCSDKLTMGFIFDWHERNGGNVIMMSAASGADVMRIEGAVNNVAIGELANFAFVSAFTFTQLSSREIKHDIEDMEDRGEDIDNLRPVTFIYDADAKERRRNGLIYEEAVEVAPDICYEDEQDGTKSINYTELVPILLKEIKSLRARVKALEERIGGE